METPKAGSGTQGIILGPVVLGPNEKQAVEIRKMMEEVTPQVTCRFCGWAGSAPKLDKCPRCQT